MIYMNQTIDNISDDYFSENNYSCVENFLMMLIAYNRVRRRKRNTEEKEIQILLNHILIFVNIIVNHYLILWEI